VGLWAAAFAEELLDDASLLRAAYDLVNRSALGAAASYGVPLPLDREMVARLLGFPRIQNNVLAVNNARGKTEAVVLDALEHLSGTASKLASDLILFSTPEFGYFELPETLCSGSSIMPQKRNPDGLELVRGKAGSIAGYAAGVKAVIRALPSGYNRDFQETKEPFLRGISETYGICAVMALTVRELRVNSAKLSEALRIELFATDEVFRLVREGQSFREAYRIVADQPKSVSRREVDQVLAARTATGTPGNLNLSAARSRLDEQLRFVEAERAREAGVIADLLGDSGIEIARAPY
jgi:argininosuccinate lyase